MVFTKKINALQSKQLLNICVRRNKKRETVLKKEIMLFFSLFRDRATRSKYKIRNKIRNLRNHAQSIQNLEKETAPKTGISRWETGKQSRIYKERGNKACSYAKYPTELTFLFASSLVNSTVPSVKERILKNHGHRTKYNEYNEFSISEPSFYLKKKNI